MNPFHLFFICIIPPTNQNLVHFLLTNGNSQARAFYFKIIIIGIVFYDRQPHHHSQVNLGP